MTTSEAIDVFKDYLTTKIVPRPMELIEASKIAIKVLTQQLEETDKYWKPTEEQPEVDLEKEEYVSVAESPLKTFQRVNEFKDGANYRH